MSFWKRLPPPALLVLGFLGAIVVGTALLMVPGATEKGTIHPVDALFTATSATCVTGLIVLDTGRDFTRFGQTVILALIQAGGLGIMTVSTFFILLMGGRLSMRDQMALQSSLGSTRIFKVGNLAVMVVAATVLFELVGGMILYFSFLRSGMGGQGAAFTALFHSVSAFCNAGFSLYSDSITAFRSSWSISGTIMGLFFLGGLGFMVLTNLAELRPWRRDKTKKGRLSLQSKVVLSASLVLSLAGAVLFALFEWGNTQAGLPFKERIITSLFQSLTPRTAGFNVLPMGDLGNPALFLTMILMFIGASPGSTGGGVKTCTFVVLLAVCRCFVKHHEDVVLFKRSLKDEAVRAAICITVISLALVSFLFLLLLVSEQGRMGFPDILFEVFSAFGTVGLSTGVTPHLSIAGKLIITVTMFIGRISPITLALLVSRVDHSLAAVRFPEEGIMVG